MRISLIHALVLFAFAGMSLAALVSGHPLWGDVLFFLAAAALILGALAALAWDGDPRRWFAIGFVLVGSLAFWNTGADQGEGIRRLPFFGQVVEFFHDRHMDRISVPVGNGKVAYLTESGRVIERDPSGALRALREPEAISLGYPVEKLRILRSEAGFQNVADNVVTLLLAYLGGVAGTLVRRARRVERGERRVES